MRKNYIIEGMSCQNCVARVTTALEHIPNIKNFKVQLTEPQLTIDSDSEIALHTLDNAIGKYAITHQTSPETIKSSRTFLQTYKPLLLIVSFIAMTTLLSQYPFPNFDGMLWMRHFMAGFFIVFAFFKFLNLKGFADSYRMYDIIASNWFAWGLLYPFIELGLGILYLTNVAPTLTNIATIGVLGVSSIGVIKSNLNKEKIQCACLGDVFDLPMSTVTIIEDVSMVLMAGVMLVVGC